MFLYQVQVRFSFAGSNIGMNVWTFQHASNDPDETEDVLEYLGNAYHDFVRPFMGSASNLVNMLYRPTFVAGYPFQEYIPDGWPAAGQASGEVLPSMNAPFASFRSLGPRPNAVRKYFPPSNESMWQGNSWVSSVITNLTNFCGEIIAMPEELDGEPFFCSARFVEPTLPTWQSGGPLQTFLVQPYARTQRRRRPGVGM